MADASVGSLSSYAYILMLLHYLQRTDPPVIPVLQEVHNIFLVVVFLRYGYVVAICATVADCSR